MGVFKLGGMTMKSLFRKAPTRRYPYERREPFERTRGQIGMRDIDSCILCGICQRGCPADAIVVDRKAGTWKYWPYACIACDLCVRACPVSDLEMLPERPPVATDKNACIEYACSSEKHAADLRKAEGRGKKAAVAKEKAAQATEA